MDLPRESDIGAGPDVRVIEEGRERPSRLLWRCREASKEARDPEADAAFVGDCRLRHDCESEREQNRDLRPQRDCHRKPLIRFLLIEAPHAPHNVNATKTHLKSGTSKWRTVQLVNSIQKICTTKGGIQMHRAPAR